MAVNNELEICAHLSPKLPGLGVELSVVSNAIPDAAQN